MYSRNTTPYRLPKAHVKIFTVIGAAGVFLRPKSSRAHKETCSSQPGLVEPEPANDKYLTTLKSYRFPSCPQPKNKLQKNIPRQHQVHGKYSSFHNTKINYNSKTSDLNCSRWAKKTANQLIASLLVTFAQSFPMGVTLFQSRLDYTRPSFRRK